MKQKNNPVPISFHRENVDYEIPQNDDVRQWVKSIILKYEKEVGEIAFIFCSDDYLLKINQEYLNHDTYTDIITFNYNENNLISGDIFISVDRVKENAKEFIETTEKETLRVLSHGVLHLIGFNDKTKEEAAIMRKKEEECLLLWREQCST